MSKLIENAKSYKTQIKKTNKESYFKEWKEEIKREIVKDSLSKFFVLAIYKNTFHLLTTDITRFISFQIK